MECSLMDPFAILIQILMAALAFSTLIYKRHVERPQRPVRIWAFDVSKQVIGACLMHGLNILASVIAGSVSEHTNPCVWYFLNIFVDCTLGVFIMFVLIKAVHKFFVSIGVQGMKTGEYGKPPRWSWWMKQTAAFVFCLVTMKIVVLLVFRLCPFLVDFGNWMLGWTFEDERLQLVFVLLIFPLIMNIVQFWLVDQVIKKHFEGVRLDDDDGYGNEDDAFLVGSYNMDGELSAPFSSGVHKRSIGSNSPSTLAVQSITVEEADDKDITNASRTDVQLKQTPFE